MYSSSFLKKMLEQNQLGEFFLMGELPAFPICGGYLLLRESVRVVLIQRSPESTDRHTVFISWYSLNFIAEDNKKNLSAKPEFCSCTRFQLIG